MLTRSFEHYLRHCMLLKSFRQMASPFPQRSLADVEALAAVDRAELEL